MVLSSCILITCTRQLAPDSLKHVFPILSIMLSLTRGNESVTNFTGHIMEVKGSSGGNHRAHFKSIKKLDHALIKKLAIITGVVIAADVVCYAIYLLLKKLVTYQVST